jgi:hypothetical protein
MKRKPVDWKSSIEAHKALCRFARSKARGANQNSAIAKSKPPQGVVVVNPKGAS